MCNFTFLFNIIPLGNSSICMENSAKVTTSVKSIISVKSLSCKKFRDCIRLDEIVLKTTVLNLWRGHLASFSLT